MSAHPSVQSGVLALRVTPGVSGVVIEWGVSRLALGDLAPKGPSALLTLRYEGASNAPECWSLLDPRSQETRALSHPIEPAGYPQVRCSGGCVHVHSPSMYAFVSVEDDEPNLLYARTQIFEALGIAGGRYHPLGVRVIEGS
jgi:hypothetical protein